MYIYFHFCLSLFSALHNVELRVCGVGNELCTISAKRTDSVSHVKKEISIVTGVPCGELCLLHGVFELYDEVLLDSIPIAAVITLTLLRRTPEISQWIQMVRQDGGQLSQAPAHIQADRGVVLCAVQRRGLALSYAADALKADRGVVLAAVAKNGLALEHAAESLRADREVALTAVRQCGVSLEFSQWDG